MRWNIIVECVSASEKMVNNPRLRWAPSSGLPGVRLRKTSESIFRNRSRWRIGGKTP
jgi:hypothetical protein